MHGREEAAEGANRGVSSGSRDTGGHRSGSIGRWLLLLLRGVGPSPSRGAVEPPPERRVGKEALEGAGDVAGGPEVEESGGDGSLGGEEVFGFFFCSVGEFFFFFSPPLVENGKNKTALSLFVLLTSSSSFSPPSFASSSSSSSASSAFGGLAQSPTLR